MNTFIFEVCQEVNESVDNVFLRFPLVTCENRATNDHIFGSESPADQKNQYLKLCIGNENLEESCQNIHPGHTSRQTTIHTHIHTVSKWELIPRCPHANQANVPIHPQ